MPKKTGICLNIGGNCSMAKNKEIQTADVTHFKCSECGRDLIVKAVRIVPWYKKPAIMIPATVLLIGGGVAATCFLPSGETSTSSDLQEPAGTIVEQTPQDPPKQEITTEETDTASLPAPTNGTDLGYAVWTGDVNANGLPNDTDGRMYFKERHRISPNDDHERYAEAGESIVGEYINGKLIQGKWYKKDKNVEFIILGN